ncbi:hypothetical protein CDD80_3342 [Ophiocordyceps camponoti-rufipedis]|uniref:Uncharacterized protein n=1 Tax=Ophiocordyceps camponoti-rufipedis TaxID=2004952 RepID=A0A2C5ZMM7_9HYPO|nr:hypothetical protein CDD80_3342 [Ophiocordyceps camponoti-rufipedis]
MLSKVLVFLLLGIVSSRPSKSTVGGIYNDLGYRQVTPDQLQAGVPANQIVIGYRSVSHDLARIYSESNGRITHSEAHSIGHEQIGKGVYLTAGLGEWEGDDLKRQNKLIASLGFKPEETARISIIRGQGLLTQQLVIPPALIDKLKLTATFGAIRGPALDYANLQDVVGVNGYKFPHRSADAQIRFFQREVGNVDKALKDSSGIERLHSLQKVLKEIPNVKKDLFFTRSLRSLQDRVVLLKKHLQSLEKGSALLQKHQIPTLKALDSAINDFVAIIEKANAKLMRFAEKAAKVVSQAKDDTAYDIKYQSARAFTKGKAKMVFRQAIDLVDKLTTFNYGDSNFYLPTPPEKMSSQGLKSASSPLPRIVFIGSHQTPQKMASEHRLVPYKPASAGQLINSLPAYVTFGKAAEQAAKEAKTNGLKLGYVYAVHAASNMVMTVDGIKLVEEVSEGQIMGSAAVPRDFLIPKIKVKGKQHVKQKLDKALRSVARDKIKSPFTLNQNYNKRYNYETINQDSPQAMTTEKDIDNIS